MKLSLAFALVAAAISTVSAAICKGIAPPSYTAAVQANPQFAPAINMIKQYPVANWYVDCGSDSIDALMASCPTDTPVIIVYGLPQKECASSYSSNGKNTNAGEYKAWIQSLANKIGNRKVIYILEPDAIGLLSTGDGSKCAVKYGYQANLAAAASILSANSNAQIYADVAGWAFQAPAIEALQGLGKLSGISINTSNYKRTVDMMQVCESYSRQLEGLHFIIDTSRNFNGSPQNEWCNAKSAGIGAPPTDQTGSPLVDYYLWLKVPGESDGQCAGQSSDSSAGPDAGLFFPDGFQRLWDQGYFVLSQGAPKIGQAPAPAPTPAPANTQCAIEANIDYYGNDMTRHPVSGNTNDQVSNCCTKCSAASGCTGFTINGGFSYLKNKLENKRWSESAVSGSRSSTSCGATQANTDYYGNDITRHAVSGDANGQVSDCCNKCSATSSYKRWSATAVSCSRSSGSCGATQVNTDYYGNDITRHPVSGDVNNQVSICCDKCSTTSDCAGFTINDGFCYLKSKLENKSWSGTAVSASRSSSRLRRVLRRSSSPM
ncbi:hypothetical protein SPRG_07827 [Saprolegnia parasitica CBS 223.65]|uniref:Apple domain-containing protein n=1 Tax=Saprolegnia parasitica (strain CBS 223.65) TaxID=695850 RepID=A0A067CKM6_SAPPC|nr:hypothetical protein SPRG_07827 [Saprolegnia parasitica CBS 223.65]KDO27116.1 hypothetical protein SPRG_07827 [Saprolegnia parasitica CBS 223.65]|eukprot:XP_012202209.1 hypothetical protein SPRG_07827 [Saprolegnia parasitica CBS 223.65]